MKYTIVIGYTVEKLIENVNRRIEQGYVAVGGICIFNNNGFVEYYQAMVLK